jgi:D-amino-acid dehydrogenase
MAYDAVVIGGGLAGTSAAYHLCQSGLRTLLVDRRDRGRATDAGAGILSPETTKNDREDWYELVRACGDHYRRLVVELEDGGAGETGYARCGLLTLALADWDVAAYEETTAVILDRQRRRSYPGTDALREISADDARGLFPPLGTVTRALFFRDAARVDGRLMNAAVQRGATSAGLQTVQGDAKLVLSGDRATSVDVAGERHACGAVVVAGGAWSHEFGGALGFTLPVAPQRGQIVHLMAPGADTAAWPIAQPVLGMYFVPWRNGRLAVGATSEPDAGFDARATAAGMRLVFSEVMRVAPGLAGAEFGEVRVGLRPVSVDDLPVLGAVPGWTNIYLATGYGAHGLLLSPYCGRLAADVVIGRTPDLDITPFHVNRFVGQAG